MHENEMRTERESERKRAMEHGNERWSSQQERGWQKQEEGWHWRWGKQQLLQQELVKAERAGWFLWSSCAS